jgi:hypothetical protein
MLLLGIVPLELLCAIWLAWKAGALMGGVFCAAIRSTDCSCRLNTKKSVFRVREPVNACTAAADGRPILARRAIRRRA